MPYTLSQPIFLVNAGLAPSAQLFDTAGANVGAAVTTGFLDRGNGLYLWTYASYPDGFRGGVDVSVAGEKLATLGINPEEAENVDVKLSSRAAPSDVSAGILFPAARVNYIGPVVANGNITLLQGDDYANADDRALVFDEAGAGWPVLTSATVRLKSRHKHGMGENLNATGTVVTATGTSKSVRFDLTTAQTGALGPRDHLFDIEATLSTGRVATLHQGNLFVLEQA